MAGVTGAVVTVVALIEEDGTTGDAVIGDGTIGVAVIEAVLIGEEDEGVAAAIGAENDPGNFLILYKLGNLFCYVIKLFFACAHYTRILDL